MWTKNKYQIITIDLLWPVTSGQKLLCHCLSFFGQVWAWWWPLWQTCSSCLPEGWFESGCLFKHTCGSSICVIKRKLQLKAIANSNGVLVTAERTVYILPEWVVVHLCSNMQNGFCIKTRRQPHTLMKMKPISSRWNCPTSQFISNFPSSEWDFYVLQLKRLSRNMWNTASPMDQAIRV